MIMTNEELTKLANEVRSGQLLNRFVSMTCQIEEWLFEGNKYEILFDGDRLIKLTELSGREMNSCYYQW